MPQIPQPLLNSLAHLPGFDEPAFVAAHAEENRITSIRLNPFKKTALDFELNAAVPWAEDAFYLDERPSFTLDPLFHAGCYYVQEAGSMFIEFALKQALDLSKPLKVLDLCAAPGGKSTLVNSLLNEESLLVANEFVKPRAGILAQNLAKWGTCNTVVTNNDAARFSGLNAFFDAIVVDVPCSGSGLFRKQPDAVDEWSEAAVTACSVRQQRILEDCIPALKENGILIYSTCSYSEKENEEIVDWLITQGFEYVQLPVNTGWGIVESRAGYRFYPHLTKSEGFFCAVLRKTAHEQVPFMPKKKTNIDPSKAELITLAPFLALSDNYIIKKNEQFHLLNRAAHDFLIAFERQFYFKKAGAVIGEIKGSDMIPNQELAWSLNTAPGALRVELSKEDALKFLRKENFKAPENAKGLALLTYKHYGLGWAKILPNRINNYLPNELRILK
jgi:16S rRNA C967 or C1407 C5-methylase (RsmB/RsmF family)/NOL1/NOP2/fmu family ribosome biogenesis protein